MSKSVKKMVKKLSKSCQKVVKKLTKSSKFNKQWYSGGGFGVGWGNSSSKAFGISFADRPKAKSDTTTGAAKQAMLHAFTYRTKLISRCLMPACPQVSEIHKPNCAIYQSMCYITMCSESRSAEEYTKSTANHRRKWNDDQTKPN
jgi:hypothetical protein